jgi:hypothetical protein
MYHLRIVNYHYFSLSARTPFLIEQLDKNSYFSSVVYSSSFFFMRQLIWHGLVVICVAGLITVPGQQLFL